MKKTFAVYWPVMVSAMCVFLALGKLVHAQLAPTNKPARVLVAWDPNPEPDIGGYKIYHGTNSRVYAVVFDVGNVTNAILSNFTRGVTYFFAATAYNTIPLESDFSEEVSLTIPALPVPPANVEVTNTLSIVAVGAFLEKANDVVGPWSLAVSYPTNYIDPKENTFYRIGLTINQTP